MKTAFALVLTSFLAIAACINAAPASAQPRTWSFQVALDGKGIGFHRFTLSEEGIERDLSTEARFDVKLLGIRAYAYRHSATEHWRGDCLATLSARTDDNGERTLVTASREGGIMKVTGGAARTALEGCVMTFAYWNPAILRQTHLLNSQTGAYEAVKVARVGEETLAVRGVDMRATRYRITGSKHPIDVWYSAANEWLALESTVRGGRRLTYRLE